MYKLFCDLCGKEITGTSRSKYKIKKLGGSFHESWWDTIDVHNECVEKLYNAVKPKEPTPPNSGSNIIE